MTSVSFVKEELKVLFCTCNLLQASGLLPLPTGSIHLDKSTLLQLRVGSMVLDERCQLYLASPLALLQEYSHTHLLP
jgi:hypothetical protein